MNVELSLKELKRIINCMEVADDEYGPLEDKSFYKLLKKLKQFEKDECQADEKINSEIPKYDKIPVEPQKCLCIHALDGYETYKIDEHTIGVRPIWVNTKDRLPPHLEDVLFLYSDKKGSSFLTGWYDEDCEEWICTIVGFFRDLSEKACSDSHFKKNKIKYWMHLPKLPEK